MQPRAAQSPHAVRLLRAGSPSDAAVELVGATDPTTAEGRTIQVALKAPQVGWDLVAVCRSTALRCHQPALPASHCPGTPGTVLTSICGF